MRKILTSNLLTMIWTNQSWEFNIMEWLPKRKEVKYIQIITEYWAEDPEEVITTKLIISAWEDINNRIPLLPSEYINNCLEESKTQVIDQTTWAITVTINYTYYEALYTISFWTNSTQSSYSNFDFIYSTPRIVVPSIATMRIWTSYERWDTINIQFYIWAGLLWQVTATPPAIPSSTAPYIWWFTYSSTWIDYASEWRDIRLTWDKTLYWVFQTYPRIDIQMDCSNWTIYEDDNHDDRCWLYRAVGDCTIRWEPSTNAFYYVDINPFSTTGSSTTININKATAPDWYKIKWIDVKYPNWTTTRVDNQNYQLKISYYDGIAGKWNISTYLEEYSWYQYYWFSGDMDIANTTWRWPLYSDSAWKQSLVDAIVAAWWTASSVNSCYWALRVEWLNNSCSTVSPTEKYYYIVSWWSYQNPYTIFIDITSWYWTYFTWNSTIYSSASSKIAYVTNANDFCTFLKTCNYAISAYDYQYVYYSQMNNKCLFNTDPNTYGTVMSKYDNFKTNCIAWANLLI